MGRAIGDELDDCPGQRYPPTMGWTMKALRVSDDNKVTLSAEVRRMSGIQAGQRLIAIPKGGGILLMPVEPASSIRGIAAGVETAHGP